MSATRLTPPSGDPLTLEFTGLRVFNVENLSNSQSASDKVDVRAVDLVRSVESHLGSGAGTGAKKDLRNIGPSVSYKLRDAAGQAREYNNYMVPVELDGQRVFLAGVRDAPSEPMRYLRIPADEKDSLTTWLLLRGALLDEAQRGAAVDRYVATVTPKDKPELAAQLAASAKRGLALFAGAEQKAGSAPGGLPAIAEFLEANVPTDERNRASEVLIRIMNGSLFELMNLARERTQLPRMDTGEKTQGFMTHMVLSLSDSFFYPAPMLLQLQEFKQVQGQRVPAHPLPWQEAGLHGVCPADPGGICHALHSRAPPVGVAWRPIPRRARATPPHCRPPGRPWTWTANSTNSRVRCRPAASRPPTRRTTHEHDHPGPAPARLFFPPILV